METSEFYYNSPNGLTSFSHTPPPIPEASPPNSAIYKVNADKYRAWLAKEGYNLPEDLRRLKRRQILTNGITPRAADNSSNFFSSPEAAVFRNQYELTRRSRPNLTPAGAFNVTLANEPGLLRNMSPDQLLQLASRYVVQDNRHKGDASDTVSNATYDSHMLDKDISPMKRLTHSAATNWTTNFVYPVFDTAGDMASILPRLGATALRIPPGLFRRLGILDQDTVTHVDTVADATDAALDWLKKKSVDWIPRKEKTADTGLGYMGYDRFNRLSSSAAGLASIPLLGQGLTSPAASAFPLSLSGIKTLPNAWKFFKSQGSNTWQRANNLYGKYIGLKLAGNTVADVADTRELSDGDYAGDSGVFGPDIDIDDNKGLVTVTRGADTHVPVLDLNGVSYGTDIKPNNLGLFTAASTLPKNHPIRKRVSDTFKRKIIDANNSGYPRIELDTNGSPTSNYATLKPIKVHAKGR